MLRSDPRRVTAHFDGTLICAEYSEQTGQLCLRQDGTLLREWFPPHSWMAIASVAGARHWGTRPSDDDLLALRHYRLVEMIDDGDDACALRLTGLGERLLQSLGASDARPA